MYAEWARYLFAYCPFNQCVDPLSPPTIPLHSQSPPCALAENPPAAPCGIQILCSPAPRRVMPLCGPSTSSSSWPPPPVLSPPRPNSGLLAAVGGGPRDVFEVELLECVCVGGGRRTSVAGAWWGVNSIGHEYAFSSTSSSSPLFSCSSLARSS